MHRHSASQLQLSNIAALALSAGPPLSARRPDALPPRKSRGQSVSFADTPKNMALLPGDGNRPSEGQISPKEGVNGYGLIEPPLLPPALNDIETVLEEFKTILESEKDNAPAQELFLRDQVQELSSEVEELTESLKATSVSLIQTKKACKDAQDEAAALRNENAHLSRLVRQLNSKLQQVGWFHLRSARAANDVSDVPIPSSTEAVSSSSATVHVKRPVLAWHQTLLATCMSFGWGVSTTLFACSVLIMLAVLASCSIIYPNDGITTEISASECVQHLGLQSSLSPRWSIFLFRHWKAAVTSPEGGWTLAAYLYILLPAAVLLCVWVWIGHIIQVRSNVKHLPVDRGVPLIAKAAGRKALAIRMVSWTVVIGSMLVVYALWTSVIMLANPAVCVSAELPAWKCAALSGTTLSGLACASFIAAVTLQTGGFGYFDMVNTLRMSATLDVQAAELLPNTHVYNPSLFSTRQSGGCMHIVLAVVVHLHSAAILTVGMFVVMQLMHHVGAHDAVFAATTNSKLWLLCIVLVAVRLGAALWEITHIVLAIRALDADERLLTTSIARGDEHTDGCVDVLRVLDECRTQWMQRARLFCTIAVGFIVCYVVLVGFQSILVGNAALQWDLRLLMQPQLAVVALLIMNVSAWPA